MSDYWIRRQREAAFVEKFGDSPRVISAEAWARVEFHSRRVRAMVQRMESKGKKIGPGHCVWDLNYAFGRLLSDSRSDYLAQPFFDEVQEYFAPQNAKERNAAHSLAFKVFMEALGGQNFFSDTWSDAQCVERIEAAREEISSGRWKQVSIGPKSTPLLHAMRNRLTQRETASVN